MGSSASVVPATEAEAVALGYTYEAINAYKVEKRTEERKREKERVDEIMKGMAETQNSLKAYMQKISNAQAANNALQKKLKASQGAIENKLRQYSDAVDKALEGFASNVESDSTLQYHLGGPVMSTEPPAPTRGMVIRGSCDVNGDLGDLLGRNEVPQWRRHFVGDREFWRWTGKNPETGQWYTQEEKDASIAFDAPDETVSPDKDEGKSPGDTAWFETHWSRNPAAANVESCTSDTRTFSSEPMHRIESRTKCLATSLPDTAHKAGRLYLGAEQ